MLIHQTPKIVMLKGGARPLQMIAKIRPLSFGARIFWSGYSRFSSTACRNGKTWKRLGETYGARSRAPRAFESVQSLTRGPTSENTSSSQPTPPCNRKTPRCTLTACSTFAEVDSDRQDSVAFDLLFFRLGRVVVSPAWVGEKKRVA